MSDIDDNEEAYLEVPPENIRTIAMPETVWAKIGENNQLEVIRWDIIGMYALEYDALAKAEKEPTQTHVICKLLTLVREQTRKECEQL
jgi:hypothetical protein